MGFSKITYSLFTLTLAYIFVGVVSYSVFFNFPVFVGGKLTWQSIVEQFTTWIPLLFSYLLIIKSILTLNINKNSVNLSKISILGLTLLFLSAFSVGAHAVAQIVEDALIPENNVNVYSLVLFLDEIVGHIFLITLFIGMYLLCILELASKPYTFKKFETSFLTFLSIINGFFWGISAIEGGSMYLLLVPTALLLLVILFRRVKKTKINLYTYPFTLHYCIAGMIMILTILIWIAFNGWFVQPSDLDFILNSPSSPL